MDFDIALQKVKENIRYRRNVEFGEPRSGHPEGAIKNHIVDLENNLELIKHLFEDPTVYSKLKFIIHIHDTFKAEVEENSAKPNYGNMHSILAMKFAKSFVCDEDILNIILLHDENYALWKQFKKNGTYNTARFHRLINLIEDIDLFLIFTIIDGATKGKEIQKLSWFLNEVKKFRESIIDENYIKIIVASLQE